MFIARPLISGFPSELVGAIQLCLTPQCPVPLESVTVTRVLKLSVIGGTERLNVIQVLQLPLFMEPAGIK